MVPMTSLTWVSGSFSAHVVAARLQSEGIDVELRGAIDSPYGLTVGDMARVDVYVPEDQLDDARMVLLIDEVDATLTTPRDWDAPTRRKLRWPYWAALVVMVVAIGAPLVRTVFG
jgi:Putative prokaryotic signal transducing protein